MIALSQNSPNSVFLGHLIKKEVAKKLLGEFIRATPIAAASSSRAPHSRLHHRPPWPRTLGGNWNCLAIDDLHFY